MVKSTLRTQQKQIPWPVEVGQKKDDYKGVIHIPHYDLDKAHEHMMVQHLVNKGYVIQQTIAPISETKVFDPIMRLKDERPVQKQQGDNEFGIGKRFRVKSTSTRLEITDSRKDSLTMKYPDGEKMPFNTTVQQVEKALNLGTWMRI